jgi:hypothetical protein
MLFLDRLLTDIDQLGLIGMINPTTLVSLQTSGTGLLPTSPRTQILPFHAGKKRPRKDNSLFPKPHTSTARRARRPIPLTPPVRFHPSKATPMHWMIISLSLRRYRPMANWRWPEWHAGQITTRPTSHRQQAAALLRDTREKAEATQSLPPPPRLSLSPFLSFASSSSPRAATRAHRSTPRCVPMASSSAFVPLLFFLLMSTAPFLAFASEPRNPEGKCTTPQTVFSLHFCCRLWLTMMRAAGAFWLQWRH